MGHETKGNELRRGNYDPLHATRKGSSADAVDEEPAQVVQMPATAEQSGRRSPRSRKRK